MFRVSKRSISITKILVNNAVQSTLDNTSFIYTKSLYFFLPAIWENEPYIEQLGHGAAAGGRSALLLGLPFADTSQDKGDAAVAGKAA